MSDIGYSGAIAETAVRINVVLGESRSSPVSDTTAEAAREVWGLLLGQLRGEVPEPVPDDLMAVAVSAGARIAKGVTNIGTMFLNGDAYAGQMEFRPWTGF